MAGLVVSGMLTLAVLLSAVACQPGQTSAPPRPTATPVVLRQWASTASASSHYGRPDWSPNRATGAPEISACADDARAWASARGGGVEWLELSFAQPVYPTAIAIHQTYGRGSISRVSVLDSAGNRRVVWEGTDDPTPCPGVLTIRIAPSESQVSAVRVDLDESRTGTWNQIDAVELVGVP